MNNRTLSKTITDIITVALLLVLSISLLIVTQNHRTEINNYENKIRKLKYHNKLLIQRDSIKIKVTRPTYLLSTFRKSGIIIGKIPPGTIESEIYGIRGWVFLSSTTTDGKDFCGWIWDGEAVSYQENRGIFRIRTLPDLTKGKVIGFYKSGSGASSYTSILYRWVQIEYNDIIGWIDIRDTNLPMSPEEAGLGFDSFNSNFIFYYTNRNHKNEY